MKQPFAWDHYSDQPAIIRDRALKRQMRRSALPSLMKTFLIALITLPIAFLLTPFAQRRTITGKEFFGMGVNLDKEPNTTPYLLEELGIQKLLIRIPLWEMDRLHEYVAFIRSFSGKQITVVLLQDREHITSPDMSRDHFIQIFEALEEVCETYVIGSTINRAKWGFFSVNEYLDFYGVAYELKKTRFTHLKLIGSNVIDFEYHFSAHTLFNLARIRFDALGSLLYVDRRGAPENTQLGFNLMGKINLLYSLMTLSSKTTNELIITETNWPIKNTAPYAPTSEHECVSEEDYAAFMVRYHLLSFASQKVSCVYWHQLIAPGYGLIDNREGIIRKRSAFEAYRIMKSHFGDAEFMSFSLNADEYRLICATPRGELHVTWTLTSAPIYTYKAQS
ncbi:MAG: glycosyl hydrolase [Sulfuricurvum sp.]|uniref:glycosyl hydrolase n=1 Tax=Sulfuricurvum sp. TaxID=2025608 RepID=UPI0025D2A29B|nr:glycosyl hydrolase [Sulfuricurvum sp.]MBV5320297.1 glycosyl hydrolase [Sulfuricurvum sp.]